MATIRHLIRCVPLATIRLPIRYIPLATDRHLKIKQYFPLAMFCHLIVLVETISRCRHLDKLIRIYFRFMVNTINILVDKLCLILKRSYRNPLIPNKIKFYFSHSLTLSLIEYIYPYATWKSLFCHTIRIKYFLLDETYHFRPMIIKSRWLRYAVSLQKNLSDSLDWKFRL